MAREDAAGRCRAIAEALEFYGVEPRRGAEIGVYEGDLSALLLRRYPDLMLYMVDWWRAAAPDSDYRKSGDKLALLTQEEMDAAYKTTQAATEFARTRRIIIEDESTLAAEFVCVAGGLDFVFIDGDHTFKAVLRDLEAWWPRVRLGGVVGGHDWYETRKRFEWFEVPQAVRAFLKTQGLDESIIRKGAETTWFFLKP